MLIVSAVVMDILIQDDAKCDAELQTRLNTVVWTNHSISNSTKLLLIKPQYFDDII